MTDPTPCTTCDHPTLPDAAWRQLPKPRRARRANGGLCVRCYRTQGDPTDTGQVSSRDMLEDWHWLHETGELSDQDPLAQRIRLSAPRIGMTYDALEKALERAGITNPAEAATMPAPNTGDMSCQQCRSHNWRTCEDQRDVRVLAQLLARDPDSPKLRGKLARAQADLAEGTSVQDAHLEWDHAETQEVAA